MPEKWICRNTDAIDNFAAHMKKTWSFEEPLEIEYRAAKSKRSVPQNSMIYEVYSRIARALYGNDMQHTRRECKLHFGVPILRADDESFCDVYDRLIKPRPYEEKLEMMEIIPVTSLMNVSQGKEFIDQIMNHYAREGVDFTEIT